MAQHDDVIFAGLIFIGRKRPPDRRRDTPDVEVAGRHAARADEDGIPGAGQGDRSARRGNQRRERRALGAPVEIVLGGHDVARTAGGLLPDLDDLIGIAVGKRFEQDAVDEAENRAGRADAERQRRDCHQREARIAPQAAPAVSQILQEFIHTTRPGVRRWTTGVRQALAWPEVSLRS
jgi:hypothetical protein